jgi:hypothetical protein
MVSYSHCHRHSLTFGSLCHIAMPLSWGPVSGRAHTVGKIYSIASQRLSPCDTVILPWRRACFAQGGGRHRMCVHPAGGVASGTSAASGGAGAAAGGMNGGTYATLGQSGRHNALPPTPPVRPSSVVIFNLWPMYQSRRCRKPCPRRSHRPPSRILSAKNNTPIASELFRLRHINCWPGLWCTCCKCTAKAQDAAAVPSVRIASAPSACSAASTHRSRNLLLHLPPLPQATAMAQLPSVSQTVTPTCSAALSSCACHYPTHQVIANRSSRASSRRAGAGRCRLRAAAGTSSCRPATASWAWWTWWTRWGPHVHKCQELEARAADAYKLCGNSSNWWHSAIKVAAPGADVCCACLTASM